MSNKRDGVDSDSVKGLAEKSAANSTLLTVVSIFIALSLAIAGQSLYSIYFYVTDDSIPLVVCPRDFNLDSPTLMKTINERDDLVIQDRWIRGFMRKAILNSFPRTIEDAELFYRWMRDHSTAPAIYKYEGYLADIEAISKSINSGNSYSFYPTSSLDLIIRPITPTSWNVEIPGFLIKKMGSIDERSTPRLRYKIEAGKPTIKNPEGLYISEFDIILSNPVTGTEEKL